MAHHTGLTIETFGEAPIVVYRFDDIARATIDMWTSHFGNLLAARQPSKTYRVLMDVSQPHLSLSPYFRSCSRQLMEEYPDHRGRMAILIANRFMATVVDFFMRAQRNHNLETRFFTEEAKAMAWLQARH